MWQPKNLIPAGHPWNEYHYKASGDAKLEDMLKPETWLHIASRLKPLDTIIVKSEAGLFSVALQVRRVMTDGVKVFPLWVADMAEPVVPGKKSNIVVEFVSGGQKWRLVRGKEVLASGFDTEEEAKAKVADYE